MKTLATNKLFIPIQVGSMELEHRVVMAPSPSGLRSTGLHLIDLLTFVWGTVLLGGREKQTCRG
jgi:hypothetical protein